MLRFWGDIIWRALYKKYKPVQSIKLKNIKLTKMFNNNKKNNIKKIQNIFIYVTKVDSQFSLTPSPNS